MLDPLITGAETHSKRVPQSEHILQRLTEPDNAANPERTFLRPLRLLAIPQQIAEHESEDHPPSEFLYSGSNDKLSNCLVLNEFRQRGGRSSRAIVITFGPSRKLEASYGSFEIFRTETVTARTVRLRPQCSRHAPP